MTSASLSRVAIIVLIGLVIVVVVVLRQRQQWLLATPVDDLPLSSSVRLAVASMEVGDSRGAVDGGEALERGVGSMVVVAVQEPGECGASFIVG